MRYRFDEEPLLGWILNLNSKERVFIPFVCQKCGECCREVSVRPIDFKRSIMHFPMIDELANYLNLTEDEVRNKYFGNIENWYVAKKPCMFLEDDKCRIYHIRPYPCRVFPVLREDGEKYECPVKMKCQQACNKIGKSFKNSYREKYHCAKPPEVYVKPENWATILKRYRSMKFSEEGTKIFIDTNEPKYCS